MLVTSDIDAVCDSVSKGGVIAYPTEAVFGLGCDPNNLRAVETLLQVKKRSPDKGLILIASSFDQLRPFLGPHVEPTKEQSTPAPITWIFEANRHTSELLTGDHDTLAVRVSAHPLVQALCSKLQHPLTSTSANLSGEAPCKYTHEIADQFLHHQPAIGAVLDGPIGGQLNPTEIRDASSGKILRHS
jgi:L-threonylcarbamoyladenylate synthase